jgi:hypothetical protein
VYVQPFPGFTGKWRVSSNGGTLPRWSADGKQIIYQHRDEILSVGITTKAGEGGVISLGRPTRLFEVEGLNDFDRSPDGKTIVVSKRGSAGSVKQLNVVLNWFEELRAKVQSKK